MFRDIVIPKNNETEFIEIAAKLGIRKLYFLYEFDDYNNDSVNKKLGLVKDHKDINVEIGLIVDQKNLSKASKFSKSLVVKSSEHDRFFIESKKVKLIYGFEEAGKKDYMQQRASGLNHVLCELINKNNVVIGFSYGSILSVPQTIISMIIGRMMQNIRLCKKYKCNFVISSFSDNPMHLRSPHDILSFFKMLGLNDKNFKDSNLFHL